MKRALLTLAFIALASTATAQDIYDANGEICNIAPDGASVCTSITVVMHPAVEAAFEAARQAWCSNLDFLSDIGEVAMLAIVHLVPVLGPAALFIGFLLESNEWYQGC